MLTLGSPKFCRNSSIHVVRINDAKLAEEYSLGALPALVYFRRGVPNVFGGDLAETKAEEVFEFLYQSDLQAVAERQ